MTPESADRERTVRISVGWTGHGAWGARTAGSRGVRLGVLAVGAACAALVLTACTGTNGASPAAASASSSEPSANPTITVPTLTGPSTSDPSTSSTSTAPTSTAAPVPPPTLTLSPAGAETTTGATGTAPTGTPIGENAAATDPETPATPGAPISPVTPITATATGGTLTAVTLTNPTEKVTVTGAFNAAHTEWHATEALGYGKSYRLSATATNAAGEAVTHVGTFTTLTPGNLTMPYLDYTGGYPLSQGATYGVGIVPVVHFDEPITNKAAAQAALSVTTTPHVAGSWYWADNQNVHFRPQKFWPTGTKVTVAANVYGVEVGNGLYGQADQQVSFTIGRTQIINAYDSAPKVDKVVVTNGAGQTLRTMNTSMGIHGGETVNGKYINFYTMGGTYTVLAHTNPEMMSSASYGLPADAPGGYKPEPIYFSTRISTDGIFLHQLVNTTWAQNSGHDVSHGCLNLNHENAVWVYNNTIVGDPVIVHGAAGAPQINLWQGGDWSVPWSTWTAGSAA